jgi:hypothetical protein
MKKNSSYIFNLIFFGFFLYFGFSMLPAVNEFIQKVRMQNLKFNDIGETFEQFREYKDQEIWVNFGEINGKFSRFKIKPKDFIQYLPSENRFINPLFAGISHPSASFAGSFIFPDGKRTIFKYVNEEQFCLADKYVIRREPLDNLLFLFGEKSEMGIEEIEEYLNTIKLISNEMAYKELLKCKSQKLVVSLRRNKGQYCSFEMKGSDLMKLLPQVADFVDPSFSIIKYTYTGSITFPNATRVHFLFINDIWFKMGDKLTKRTRRVNDFLMELGKKAEFDLKKIEMYLKNTREL